MNDVANEAQFVEEAEAVAFTGARSRKDSPTGQLRQSLGAHHFPPSSCFDGSFSSLIRDWIAPGHLPQRAMLRADDSLISFGSCFSREIRKRLQQGGSEARNFFFKASLNHTFSALDTLSWCVTGEETGQALRHARTPRGDIRKWTPDADREQYKSSLEQAGAFLFAFGTAEIWQDRETGGAAWRGVPENIFDTSRHMFRLSTVEENEGNILRIIELVRSVNSEAPIVLMLTAGASPATFRDISCLTADSASKSVLRVAIDNVMSQSLQHVYYWPSFEIVRWANPHLVWRAIASGKRPGDEDARHSIPYVVQQIIDSFIAAFYVPEDAALLLARTPVEQPLWSLTGRFQAKFGSPSRSRDGKTANGEQRNGSATELKTFRPNATRHWHALGAKPFPPRTAFEQDIADLIRTWILPGHTPPTGSLTHSARVITLGSSLAQELRTQLAWAGIDGETSWAPAELSTSSAILAFLSRCMTTRDARLALQEAGAFIFALGHAEGEQDRESSSLSSGPSDRLFSTDDHSAHLSTVAENQDNVLGIIDVIRSVNAVAPIVLMLEPEPLVETFREISCMTADCVSKSVLRVALDRVRDQRLNGVYYWPSYEIVRWAGSHYQWPAYGSDSHNPRQANRYLVAEIVDSFVEEFYVQEVVAELRALRLRELRPGNVPATPGRQAHVQDETEPSEDTDGDRRIEDP